MKFSTVAIAAALAALGLSATVQAQTFTGDTTGAPTFDRPLFSFLALSALGQNVRYDALEFTVNASGSYDFLSAATGNWDNFLFLYSPSFDPTGPLLNGVIGNDDFPGIGRAGFSGVALMAGAPYVLVTTGFDAPSFGAFTNTITGPGIATPVPEPGTWGLMALGLAGIGALVRRRRVDAT